MILALYLTIGAALVSYLMALSYKHPEFEQFSFLDKFISFTAILFLWPFFVIFSTVRKIKGDFD